MVVRFSWFKQFLAIQGTSVLANMLNNISRKGVNRYISFLKDGPIKTHYSRRENDMQLEYEVLKCLRHILNVEVCIFVGFSFDVR